MALKIAVMCQQNARKKNEVVISHHFCMWKKEKLLVHVLALAPKRKNSPDMVNYCFSKVELLSALSELDKDLYSFNRIGNNNM